MVWADLLAQADDDGGGDVNDGSTDTQSGACRRAAQAERPKRWADLSDDATDAGSASTEHLNLDQDAAEQELLERMLETMPQLPRWFLEELRAEPGQQRWNAVVAGWRSWMAERAERAATDDQRVDQSAGLLGQPQERQAAGQGAGGQTRPGSPSPTAELDNGVRVGVTAGHTRHRNHVEKEAECNDVSATDQSWLFQQARKKAKPRSGRRKPEHRDEVSEVNEGTRRKKRADLSDCTTDAGSHSDLDKDAAGQELLEKMLVAWPRMPRSLLEKIRAEPGQERWTALVAVWDQASGGTELSTARTEVAVLTPISQAEWGRLTVWVLRVSPLQRVSK